MSTPEVTPTVKEIVVTVPVIPKEPLVFSWAAWAKLSAMLHFGGTEVGGFGISESKNPLYVTEFNLLSQVSSSATVEFNEKDIQEYTWDMVDRGLEPDNFFRIWIHTHPGSSPRPSGTDEETWKMVLGHAPWAVMFILSRTGAVYCRYRIGTITQELEVQVDFSTSPEAWWDEYFERVAEWEFILEDPRDVPPDPNITKGVNWDTVWLEEDTDELYEAIITKDSHEITDEEWEFVREYEFLYDRETVLDYASIWD